MSAPATAPCHTFSESNGFNLIGTSVRLEQRVASASPTVNSPSYLCPSSQHCFSTKPLKFDSRFECGNIGQVVRLSDTVYDIRIRSDTGNDNFRLWFYFRVSNVTKNKVVYVLTISNICKAKTSFLNGATPVVRSTSRPNWERIQPSQIYYHSQRYRDVISTISQSQPCSCSAASVVSSQPRPLLPMSEFVSNNTDQPIRQLTVSPQQSLTTMAQSPIATTPLSSSAQSSSTPPQTKTAPPLASQAVSELIPTTSAAMISSDQTQQQATAIPSQTQQFCYHAQPPLPPLSSSNPVVANGGQSTKPALSISFVFDVDEDYFFALTYPYSFSMLTKYLTRCAQLKMPLFTRFTVQANEGTYSVGGNGCELSVRKYKPLELLVVGQPRSGSRVVFVFGRVHPGETPGSFTIHGMLERALTIRSTLAAKESVVFVFVPIANPDGVVLGNYRGDHTGADLNRRYRYVNLEDESLDQVPQMTQYQSSDGCPSRSGSSETNQEYISGVEAPNVRQELTRAFTDECQNDIVLMDTEGDVGEPCVPKGDTSAAGTNRNIVFIRELISFLSQCSGGNCFTKDALELYGSMKTVAKRRGIPVSPHVYPSLRQQKQVTRRPKFHPILKLLPLSFLCSFQGTSLDFVFDMHSHSLIHSAFIFVNPEHPTDGTVAPLASLSFPNTMQWSGLTPSILTQPSNNIQVLFPLLAQCRCAAFSQPPVSPFSPSLGPFDLGPPYKLSGGQTKAGSARRALHELLTMKDGVGVGHPFIYGVEVSNGHGIPPGCSLLSGPKLSKPPIVPYTPQSYGVIGRSLVDTLCDIYEAMATQGCN